MEMKLGEGYEPQRGNTPADSILREGAPNAVTCRSTELFGSSAQVFVVDPFRLAWLAAPSR